MPSPIEARPFAIALLAASLTMAFATAGAAQALPGIKASGGNATPACFTPGRINRFLKSRNPSLNPRYEDLGVHYMRHGEDLGLRWDYAFFQMIVETNTLKYTGDVDADQFNFAGLGATGGGVKGERFATISDGVRAHLEHVLMYTGTHIDNPVAERTRKVQEWKILESYQRSIRGPMTYAHLGRKWAPADRGYSADMKAIADEFYGTFCNGPDPRPEWVALARGQSGDGTANAVAKSGSKTAATRAEPDVAVLSPNPPGNSDGATRNGLGAGSLLGLSESAQAAKESAEESDVAILNPGSSDAGGTASGEAAQKTSLAAGQAKGADLKPAAGKCRVWTASYGGSKAIIIRAEGEGTTNFTVLDVHAGKEEREAQAYINAYAKGGQTIGEFASPTEALNKAFELCPEQSK